MEPEHPDPVAEGTQRSMERLMALGVLVEAGSRLAAENTRRKAERVEQDLLDQATREREAAGADRVARAEESRRTREWTRLAADPDRLRTHLGGLPFPEVARHWTHATRHADTNPTAATVLAATEDDLRWRAPAMMGFYDQYRDDGLPAREAMAYAVRDHAHHGRGPARRHPGRPPTAGALTRVGVELDREITRLAGTLDPVARSRLLQNLEENGWSARSLAHIETLLDRAADQRREASTRAGTPDDHTTPWDEIRAAWAPATAANARAGHDTTAAAAFGSTDHPVRLAAESFPVPAHHAVSADRTVRPPRTVPRPMPGRTR
jgi:hypothetical protein